MSLVHTTRVRVRYADTDQARVVYYGRYLEWLEIGRTEWLRQGGRTYGQVEADGLHLPVLEVHVSYRQPTRYDMLVEIETRCSMPRRTAVRFEYILRDAADGAVLAEAHTTHAFVDSAGKPARPPAWAKELMT